MLAYMHLILFTTAFYFY
uniref:Uncharacterized protein n=1 Tax=Rhizophora mucronata TaxID=61149 RepID=A0A2P2PFZ1_RHIMU